VWTKSPQGSSEPGQRLADAAASRVHGCRVVTTLIVVHDDLASASLGLLGLVVWAAGRWCCGTPDGSSGRTSLIYARGATRRLPCAATGLAYR
jgi:hypothetical protein